MFLCPILTNLNCIKGYHKSIVLVLMSQYFSKLSNILLYQILLFYCLYCGIIRLNYLKALCQTISVVSFSTRNPDKNTQLTHTKQWPGLQIKTLHKTIFNICFAWHTAATSVHHTLLSTFCNLQSQNMLNNPRKQLVYR